MQYNCPKCGALLEEKEVLAAVEPETPKMEAPVDLQGTVVAVPEVPAESPVADVPVPSADVAPVEPEVPATEPTV